MRTAPFHPGSSRLPSTSIGPAARMMWIGSESSAEAAGGQRRQNEAEEAQGRGKEGAKARRFKHWGLNTTEVVQGLQPN